MTDKIVEAVVAQAIARLSNYPVGEQAKAVIAAHLKALEAEGKRVISEHDLRELTTNRKIYEG